MLRLHYLGAVAAALALAGSAVMAPRRSDDPDLEGVIVDDPLRPDRDPSIPPGCIEVVEPRPAPERRAKAPMSYDRPEPTRLVAHGTGGARALRGWGSKAGRRMGGRP